MIRAGRPVAWLLEAALVLAAPAAAQVTSPAAVRADAPLSTAQQEAIDRYVTAEMARQRIPGLALGIYRAGAPIYLKGYGLADLEWQEPVTTDTRFQTGSLGKQFVAAAILRLAEQGKLDVDASITRYLPEAPARLRAVTVVHLLSHTSGIGAYDAPELTAPGAAFDLRRDFTEAQLLSAILALPPAFKPGTDWQYNNTNYVLLGILIHRVTGRFYGDWLHDQFFAPLGMRATRVISDTDVIERRASGYEIKGGVLRNQQWVSATFNATADGALYTTVEDMARWDHALSEESLLSPASRARMWTAVRLADGRPNQRGYGFGWFTGAINAHRTISHSGAWQGFTSDMLRFPDDRLSVVAFVNLDSEHAGPENITKVVAGLVSPALMPAIGTPIADDDPARAGRLRAFLARAAAGADVSADHAAPARYKRDPLAAAELTAALPHGWQDAPMVLLAREGAADGVRYRYRLGPAGDTRVLSATIAPAGTLLDYAIGPDRDAR